MNHTINARKYQSYIGDITETAALLPVADQAIVHVALNEYTTFGKLEIAGFFGSV